MGYQPWPQGQIDPMLIIPLSLDSAAENLTGANLSNFTLYFRGRPNNSRTAGTGQLAMLQQNPGQLLYKLSLADAANLRIASIEIWRILPFPSGGETVIYDIIPFTISLIS